MGTVYAVVHRPIGKRAALKVIHRRVLARGAHADINFEARVVNRIGHPNIVDVFEAGVLPDGRPYIIMEWLEGVSLEVGAARQKLPADRVIAILLRVCTH